MSSDQSKNSPSLSSQIWTRFTSLVLGEQVVDMTRQKISLDMKDITYLMEMDGEGLCLGQIYKEQ